MTDEIVKQFPLLQRQQDGKRLVYLDSAATTQRPQTVLDAVRDFYEQNNANPHRGVYALGERATAAYEDARTEVASFLNAPREEVIFTRNATETLNLIAYSWGLQNLKAGDKVAVTILEHHSNLIPWQQVCRATGAQLIFLYTGPDGLLSDREIEQKITKEVKLVAFTHVSNVLGMVTPVEKITARAHEVGALCVLDCAQSAPHLRLDVAKLGVDFLAFSGHKLYAPLGIGVLWGRKELLEAMPPFLTGGDMIESVREQDATWAPLPEKFEAGTQNAGGAVGLAAAIRWMQGIGFDTIARREQVVYRYAWQALSHVPHVKLYGTPSGEHAGAIAFNVEGAHPHDVASILDADAVCVRAGHHCAQPLLHHLGMTACCRASFAVYNTCADVDALVESLQKVRKWLGYGA
ncbi:MULTISPECIES: SufS family cysteine desulfurase [Caproicibacterium]|uniref:Cysteine desulfurase n=1 Tax=Caproicibacterium argilliputei TaxID=3030016 RepID=A0AA97D8S2_9FIRM|nr:SufS family cysteine desulfurase [Caproicibacterium argilliputei]WOC32645.1 SufS family cysteine desulfurase [Caproicibacterium argilliputei]